jgi:hypothetical protein
MKWMAKATTAMPYERCHEQERRADGPRERVVISCYENDVPAFIESELERLYGSIYSSLVQYRIYSEGQDTSTYIVREDGVIKTIFLFRQHGNRVRVLNEVIPVTDSDINRFAHYVFTTMPTVSVIAFKAIRTEVERARFPKQCFNFLEDIVVTLPPSEEDYFGMLGKGTRRNIKRYQKKLDENFPAWQYKVYTTSEIREDTVRAVVNLNRVRMAGKNKVSALDDHETERLAQLARECGLLGVVEINGRICAGALSFRAGSNYFLNVIAHDPEYDEYWLGTLSCYLTIGECIRRGGKEFHFLWGRYDYKYTLLGVCRDLDNLFVYRSRLAMLANAGLVLHGLKQAGIRKMMLWLHHAKRQDSGIIKSALTLFNQTRAQRRT